MLRVEVGRWDFGFRFITSTGDENKSIKTPFSRTRSRTADEVANKEARDQPWDPVSRPSLVTRPDFGSPSFAMDACQWLTQQQLKHSVRSRRVWCDEVAMCFGMLFATRFGLGLNGYISPNHLCCPLSFEYRLPLLTGCPHRRARSCPLGGLRW